MPSKIVKLISSFLFEYETPKIVHLRSKFVGLTNRLIQLLIIGYVIGWVIIWNKGYQEFSSIESSVTTKLKGVVKTNFTPDELDTDYPEEYNRLWDVAEYAIPPQENGAFFVLTNAFITPNQTEGYCPELSIPGAMCIEDSNCTEGISLQNGNGVFTGKCNTTFSTCEIYAWCPVEKDNIFPLGDRPLLAASENFTVLIKNSIEFPLFNKKTRNIANTANESYLSGCIYNEVTDPLCPIFRLGAIVDLIKDNYTKLATQGGVIAIIIDWECDLDYDMKYCLPSYSFRRLDNPTAPIAKGYNFRYANHFDYGKTRTLYKAYGILFVILVQGRAGKFNTIPLLMNLGSGLALLSVAVIMCDIIVLYVLKNRHFYKDKKYLMVNTADELENKECSPDVDGIRSRVKYNTFPDESES